MIVCHLQESFLNRTEREGKFEMLLEQNKNKIDKLTDIRQELDLELLKVKFSGRYIMRKFARTCTVRTLKFDKNVPRAMVTHDSAMRRMETHRTSDLAWCSACQMF